MRPKQRGFILLAGIMILLILSVLAIFIANISINQQATSVQDYEEARAYQAASAGIEWMTYQIYKNASNGCPTTLGATTVNNLGMITGMNVRVSCTFSVAAGTEVDAGNIYTVVATACSDATNCPGSVSTNNYIERRIAASAEAAP